METTIVTSEGKHILITIGKKYKIKPLDDSFSEFWKSQFSNETLEVYDIDLLRELVHTTKFNDSQNRIWVSFQFLEEMLIGPVDEYSITEDGFNTNPNNWQNGLDLLW